jgi:hypothetical protein
VTSFEDAQESQALSGLGGTSLFALDIPSVLGGLVVRVLHGQNGLVTRTGDLQPQTYLSRPVHIGDPTLTANVVANEVLVTAVH